MICLKNVGIMMIVLVTVAVGDFIVLMTIQKNHNTVHGF